MRVRLLSVGSRGDIQPFVALGVGLQARGHDVRVVAPENFAGFVQEHGLDFGAITVDYQAMAESDEVKAVMTNPLKAIPHMRQTFLPVLRTVMADSWQHTQDADALVYHPKVLAGLHIAEKLGVPPFLTLMIPGFFPTSAFANPLTPNVPGFMNRASHGATGPAATLPFKGIINDFRTETLGLRKIGGTIDET
ncbi:MAG: glycosyltransferase family 1 protein, partial [Chloroflexi bacterium]|nr:glycosyltransferase family 1 protein [Chloroflexota bacterium]